MTILESEVIEYQKTEDFLERIIATEEVVEIPKIIEQPKAIIKEEEVKKEKRTIQKEKVNGVLPNWCTKLNDVEDYLDVEDFGTIHRFQRVFEEEKRTNKFIVISKREGREDKLLHGNLTHRYLSTHISAHVEELKKTNSYILEISNSSPFRAMWYGLVESEINALTSDELSSLSSYMVTDSSVDLVKSCYGHLCVNHYDGSAKYKSDKTIHHLIKVKNKENIEITINLVNPFALIGYTDNLDNLSVILATLRGFSVSEELFTEIASKLSKKRRLRLIQHWDSLDGSLKNIYHLSNLISIKDIDNFNYGLHNSFRYILNKKLLELHIT